MRVLARRGGDAEFATLERCHFGRRRHHVARQCRVLGHHLGERARPRRLRRQLRLEDAPAALRLGRATTRISYPWRHRVSCRCRDLWAPEGGRAKGAQRRRQSGWQRAPASSAAGLDCRMIGGGSLRRPVPADILVRVFCRSGSVAMLSGHRIVGRRAVKSGELGSLLYTSSL